MSRKCIRCGYFDGRSCEAGVESKVGGCDYHYETLARMKRERLGSPPRGSGHWYTKNGNYLVFYCSECGTESIRQTRYCPECGSKKEELC